jgi:AcrR family transcriptional regulator
MKKTIRTAAAPAGRKVDAQSIEIPRTLPRGINGLPQEIVLISQRSRIVEATAHVVAEKGYADATVADIIRFAGVSRATFYELFEDKESCFLSCFEALAQAHLEVLEAGLVTPPASHPDRLIAGLTAYMTRVDADRWFARAFIGEAQSATPAIREAFTRARSRLDARIRAWFQEVQREYPDVAEPGPTIFELVHAGLGAFVVCNVRKGTLLTPLVPEMARFVFAALGLTSWADHCRDAAPH